MELRPAIGLKIANDVPCEGSDSLPRDSRFRGNDKTFDGTPSVRTSDVLSFSILTPDF